MVEETHPKDTAGRTLEAAAPPTVPTQPPATPTWDDEDEDTTSPMGCCGGCR